MYCRTCFMNSLGQSLEMVKRACWVVAALIIIIISGYRQLLFIAASGGAVVWIGVVCRHGALGTDHSRLFSQGSVVCFSWLLTLWIFLHKPAEAPAPYDEDDVRVLERSSRTKCATSAHS
jgi:hypothetical protein